MTLLVAIFYHVVKNPEVYEEVVTEVRMGHDPSGKSGYAAHVVSVNTKLQSNI